jgi:hypothetical protein
MNSIFGINKIPIVLLWSSFNGKLKCLNEKPILLVEETGGPGENH